jgi:hypothetical protein
MSSPSIEENVTMHCPAVQIAMTNAPITQNPLHETMENPRSLFASSKEKVHSKGKTYSDSFKKRIIVQCNPLSRQVSEISLDSCMEIDNSETAEGSGESSFAESFGSLNTSMSSINKPPKRAWNYSRSFARRKPILRNKPDTDQDKNWLPKSDPIPRQPIRYLSKRRLDDSDGPKKPIRYESVRHFDTIDEQKTAVEL